MTIAEALSKGLETTVIGLSIVFAVLIIIMAVLYCFALIFGEKKAKIENSITVAEQPQTVAETKKNMNEEELIAVLTAAVAASMNTSTYNLQIKSYRRVGNSKPSWNKAGVTETINNRF